MRKLIVFTSIAATIYGIIRWWRDNRRVGADLANRASTHGWKVTVSSAAHAASSG